MRNGGRGFESHESQVEVAACAHLLHHQLHQRCLAVVRFQRAQMLQRTQFEPTDLCRRVTPFRAKNQNNRATHLAPSSQFIERIVHVKQSSEAT